MKILIFTHKSDIDGMGGAVLAKLAFDSVDYVLCETFDLQNQIQKFYDNGKIYDYDMVYVTDLWLEEPMLSKVANDEKLKDKFMVFDHHESAKKEGYDKYDFALVRITDEKGMCSGTSLYYEYLMQAGLIKENKCVSDFVELTRRYDTWEWKNIYNDEMAHELTLLFDAVGKEGYIKLMVDKLGSSSNKFEFSELEQMLITNKKEQVISKLEEYSKKMIIKDVLGNKAGIVFIDYEYRNDLAEYLRNKNVDIDLVIMPAFDYGTISYRRIKENFKVREIAEYFGGKGHDYAASSPIFKDTQEKIINTLLKEPIPSKESLEALQELDYMEKHPEEYKSFHSVEELMEDLNSDD